MTFPRFFAGLCGVLVAFALTTYAINQSLWTTFIQTLICAVIIQVGYFATVFVLVLREKARRDALLKETREKPVDAKSPAAFKPTASKRHQHNV